MFFLSKVTEGSTASSLVSTSDSCNDNDNKAAVIGGSVGGGVALVLLILATVLCCRPERQNRPAAPAEDNPGPQVAVAPIANPRENLAPYNQDPPPRVNELPHNNRINP